MMTKTSKKTATKYTYGYDDEGVRCRHSKEDGWEPVEEHCLNCGRIPNDCDCEQYQCARWFCEEIGQWQDADTQTTTD